MSHWILLVIFASLGSILFNYLNRKNLKDGADSTVYAWLFEVIRLFLFLIMVPFDYRLTLTTDSVLLFLGLGGIELIAMYLFAKVHAHNELSVSSIITRLRILVVPVVAFIFLGEKLTNIQYLGVALTFLGSIALAMNGKIRASTGLKYALSFSLISGISTVVLKAATTYASTSVSMVFFSLPSAILLPVLMRSGRDRILKFTKTQIKSVSIAALANTFSAALIVRALTIAPASQINSVFLGLTSLTILVGIFALKEKELVVLKLTGAALTTLGIILLV